MTRKQKKRMYWLLLWSGLFIAVLYSPIGSPDLYSSKYSFIEYQSLVPNKGGILNSPKITYSPNLNSDELDIPDMSTVMKSNYSIGKSTSNKISNNGSSYSAIQFQSYRSNNSISGGQNSSGSVVLAGRSSRSSAGTSGITMANGITTLSTTSNINNTTTKQSVTADDPQGGTDPGGDPVGDPIPVGNGLKLFIFFGVIYTILKTKYIQTLLLNRKNK